MYIHIYAISSFHTKSSSPIILYYIELIGPLSINISKLEKINLFYFIN